MIGEELVTARIHLYVEVKSFALASSSVKRESVMQNGKVFPTHNLIPDDGGGMDELSISMAENRRQCEKWQKGFDLNRGSFMV